MMRSVRSIGVIAANQLHRMVLEGAVVWLIALSILIVFVLGLILQGVFAAEFVPARPYRVAVAESGPGPAGTVAGALGAKTEFFAVEPAAGPEEARGSVLDRESDAAVIVPAGFPHEPLAIVAPPARVVTQILDPVVRAAVGQAGAFDSGPAAVAVTGVAVQERAEDPERADAAWFSVSSFQYYGIALTVMFAMFASHVAMTYCAGDRASGAYGRIRASGVSPTTYRVAGFVSAVLMGALFVAFMRVATSLIFGFSWGSVPAWAILSVAGAASVAALSFLIMSLAPRNPRVVDNAGSVLFVLLAFLGGSSMPLPVMPDWFARAFAWLPNRVVLDGYFHVTAGGGLAAVADNLESLGVATIVLFTAAWVISAVRTRGEA